MSLNAHPELPAFDYVLPANLEDASHFLADHALDARPLAGGTDMFVRMRDGFWSPKFLVDVKKLSGMDEMTYSESGLKLGAAVNMNRVISDNEVIVHYPLLAEAARSVASYQLRTRATIIGNICNASPAGDTIGACLVYDSKLTVFGLQGFYEVPLSEFFIGPGKTILKPGDIVTAISLPPSITGHYGSYIKLGRNRLSDLSIVGISALGWKDESVPSGYQFSIALASVAPVPLRAKRAERFLTGQPVTNQTLKDAADLAMQEASPIDDVRGSARYRKAMVGNLTLKALSNVWDKIK